MAGEDSNSPIISKLYCDNSGNKVLVVRRRPVVVNGGGLVVSDASQKVVFRVDGCGALGVKGKLTVRDGGGDPIFYIRKMGGFIQLVSAIGKWEGRRSSYDGKMQPVFVLKEGGSPCFFKKNNMRVCATPRLGEGEWDFEVRGYFPDRACTIVEHTGRVVAQVSAERQMYDEAAGNFLYKVAVRQGTDQAFVIGLIAVLDNIHGESTSC